MRMKNFSLWMAFIGLSAIGPLPAANGQEGGTRPKADAAPADADSEDTRVTLEEIKQLRRTRVSREEIADVVAERGRAFEVTADAKQKLRSLGFRPAQIDAIKDASDEPLLPGKWLSTNDEQRDETFKMMESVAAKSKAAIKPVQSQHVTLWAAKDIQQTYLSDIKKLEKFFHTKCAEPIRSGLDKRSMHIVLLKDHAEYEAWAPDACSRGSLSNLTKVTRVPRRNTNCELLKGRYSRLGVCRHLL